MCVMRTIYPRIPVGVHRTGYATRPQVGGLDTTLASITHCCFHGSSDNYPNRKSRLSPLLAWHEKLQEKSCSQTRDRHPPHKGSRHYIGTSNWLPRLSLNQTKNEFEGVLLRECYIYKFAYNNKSRGKELS